MPGYNMAQPWFTQWNWNPIILVSMLFLIGIYCYGMIVLHHQYPSEGRQTGKIVAFLLGMGVLFLALVSPLNAFAHILFTGHMIQHLLLAFVVAPLLVLGLPSQMASRLLRPRWVAYVWKWLVMPLVAAI